MLFWCSINAQPASMIKKSSTSHLIKGTSRDLQKVLGYWSGIMVCTFKDGAGGCCGWSASPGFAGCDNIFGISPTAFVLYSNDQLHWFRLYGNFLNFLVS